MKFPRLLFLIVLCAVSVLAQGTFVYTNNNIAGPNSVSGFSVAANGALKAVPGSPFATGGTNIGFGGFTASNRITTAVVKNFLYAANFGFGSNNVSGFSIDPATGVLTAVPGSPFATGGVADGFGVSLATTPDDQFLIAAANEGSTITVYSIAASGALSQVPGSPFSGGPGGPTDGIKVTPDGKFLAVAKVTVNAVNMFSISLTGTLTLVAGSPFPASGSAAGLDCNCASDHLFAGDATSGPTTVSVFSIAASGALTQIPGSPFTGRGLNSNVAVLSPDENHLFVSNQFSSSITVFSVASNGALTLVPGSPFPAPGAFFPSGMATNEAGSLLYLASGNTGVYGFSIAPNGALTSVPNSPFSTGAGGSPFSLTVFPPKSCCPAPVITGASASPDTLWPPNHKFVVVAVNYTVAEPCPFTCVLTVSSNEPGEHEWNVVDAHEVQLRAERNGNDAGRVYTITVTCTNDTNKKSSSETVTVPVLHDQGHRE
jgi:6-phosphogluconolactonase